MKTFVLIIRELFNHV